MPWRGRVWCLVRRNFMIIYDISRILATGTGDETGVIMTKIREEWAGPRSAGPTGELSVSLEFPPRLTADHR
jgi:hypothetical protein